MYQVLARKWRPQRLEDLVGQQHVTRTLRNAIEASRLAHAYVFAGIRGTGKTTVARILAKCLNCEKGPTATPCNACDSCREITEGRSMDVMELDAASRTGVDDIRELQEVVSFAPVRDRYKILILDEAHMLSKSAVNALLKTLEEPPPRVTFVLATTEIHKILPTILSRCQVFEFRRVAPREVAAHLRTVCDAEGIRASDATLERIARSGEGSVRDSLSVLERVLAFCGETVDDEDARLVLGAVRTESLVDLVRALASRDAAGMLGVLDGVIAEGHDLVHFWNEAVSAVRDVLLLRTLPGRSDLLTRSEPEAVALDAAAASLSREDLTRAFQILADLEPALKGSSQPRFLFEAALIRLASLGAVRPIEEILARLGGGNPTGPAARPPAAGPAPTATTGAPQKKKPEPDLADGDPPPIETGPPHVPAAQDGASADAVARFVEAVKRDRPMLGATIDRAAAIEVSQGTVRIVFPPALDALRRVSEREENLAALRRCAAEQLGGPREVRVGITETGSAPAAAPPSAAAGAREPARAAAPAPAPVAEPERPPRRDAAAGDRQALLERARSEPGIRKLLTEFGAQVVEIRPLEEVPAEDGGSESGPTEEPV